MMGFIWFWLVAVMIVGYVVLDGFDLGVGILHLFFLAPTRSARCVSTPSVRYGMGTRCGFSPEAARSTSHSRFCMRQRSPASICL